MGKNIAAGVVVAGWLGTMCERATAGNDA